MFSGSVCVCVHGGPGAAAAGCKVLVEGEGGKVQVCLACVGR